MSVQIMGEAWHASDTRGPAELLVLLALADNADTASREAWPSIDYLAAKTKTSEQTVRRALRRLEARGQVTRIAAENTRHRAVTYRVHPAPPPDPCHSDRGATGGTVGVPRVAPEPSLTVRADSGKAKAFSENANGKDPSPRSAVVARERARARPAVTHNRRPVPPRLVEHAESILREFNAAAGQSLAAWTRQGKPSESLRRIIGALVDFPEVAQLAGAMIDRAFAAPWWTGRAQTGNVFGPGVVQRYIEEARSGPPASNPALAAFLARQGEAIDGTATDLGEQP